MSEVKFDRKAHEARLKAALHKITPIITDASKRSKLDGETASEEDVYFYVEHLLAEELQLALTDGRLAIEDVTLLTSYHTLLLAAQAKLSQQVMASLEEKLAGKLGGYSLGEEDFFGGVNSGNKGPLN